MTPRRRHRISRATLEQGVIPVALLALLALIGGLAYHARQAEASHRAAAESALRDYAAVAAWQFSRDAGEELHQAAHSALVNVSPFVQGRQSAQRPLPPPDTLVRLADTTECPFAFKGSVAFRLNLPERTLVMAGEPVDAATRAALAARVLADARLRSPRDHPVRMLVDTLGGVLRAVAIGVVRDGRDQPRAVYGVMANAAVLAPSLGRIARTTALLPPSLVRDRPVDSLLALQVTSAAGAPLFATGAAPASSPLAAVDTTRADHGALRTTVTLRAPAARLLLIGGVPESRLPLLAAIMAAAVLLAAVALAQVRRARELTRLRTRFVANVSHELRTPLAQISMFSETLLLGRERSADERQHFLSVVFREAHRLTHLVESVLSFSRAEAGPRAVRPERHDVAAEVRDAVRAFEPLARAANVTLCTQLAHGASALVEPAALRQVLLNLLDNAVKFGPEGQQVTVGVARVGPDVVVSVEDEGPGIAPSDRRRVFEPFAQGEQPRGRRTSGAGIGLAVVAELVAAHGGRVVVESGANGRGARVIVALRAVPPGVTHQPVAPEPASVTALSDRPDHALAGR